jgi:hypothetical protein
MVLEEAWLSEAPDPVANLGHKNASVSLLRLCGRPRSAVCRGRRASTPGRHEDVAVAQSVPGLMLPKRYLLGGRSAPPDFLSRPFVFFAPRFVLIQTFGNVGSDGWIYALRNGGPCCFVIFFPSAFIGKRGAGGALRYQLLPDRCRSIADLFYGFEKCFLRHAQRLRPVFQLPGILRIDLASIRLRLFGEATHFDP